MFIYRQISRQASPPEVMLLGSRFLPRPVARSNRQISCRTSSSSSSSSSSRLLQHGPWARARASFGSSAALKSGGRAGTTARETRFLLRPAAWLALALGSAAAGAGAVLLSTINFIAYTDAESLAKFEPATGRQREIEEHIAGHALTKALRAKPHFTESRPTLKVHEAYRSSSLTAGALTGPGRLEVPPFVWQEDGGKSLVSIAYLGRELCGYPGLVHGGLLATLLDEGLARCCFPALPSKIGMTANLTVNYRRPSPAGSFVVLRARTVKVDGRKAWVEGRIETLASNGESPVVLVEATALMVEPKHAKLFRSLMPVR